MGASCSEEKCECLKLAGVSSKVELEDNMHAIEVQVR